MRDDARVRAEQALAERNAKRRAKHTVRTWDAYRGSDAASPIIGGRSGAADPPPSPIQVGGGAHIELECDGHPLDGTPVEFDTVVAQDGWRASMPRSTFHFPLGGYYDLGETWVEFAPADVWKGDVDFRLFVNGQLRRAQTVYATELGVPIPHLQIGNVNAGDEWHIEFEATAIATSPGPVPAPTKIHSIMQLVDRQVGEVFEPGAGPILTDLRFAYRSEDVTDPVDVDMTRWDPYEVGPVLDDFGGSSGNPPTLRADVQNGRQAVEFFAGTGQLHQRASIGSGIAGFSPTTKYLAIRPTSPGMGGADVEQHVSGGAPSGVTHNWNLQIRNGLWRWVSSNAGQSIEGGTVQDAWQIVCAVAGPGGTAIYVNNTQVASGAGGTGGTTYVRFGPSSGSNSMKRGWNGFLGEGWAFQAEHDAAQRQQMFDYLAARWL